MVTEEGVTVRRFILVLNDTKSALLLRLCCLHESSLFIASLLLSLLPDTCRATQGAKGVSLLRKVSGAYSSLSTFFASSNNVMGIYIARRKRLRKVCLDYSPH